MERRTFLGLFWLSLLSSISWKTIGCAIAKSQEQDKYQLPQFIAQSEPTIADRNSSSNALVFYVDPNGNDAWSGKEATASIDGQNGPFATITKARDAIRELKQQQGGTLQQPVDILIRSGDYYLSQPITFTPEDSGTADYPITYKAYTDEKPVISGGVAIEGWQKRDRHWVAKLPDVQAGKWYFRSLRVGEKRGIRARYPKFDANKPIQAGWLFAQPLDRSWEKGTFDAGVSGIQNQGDRLEWKINVPATSSYQVWLRYAHNMKPEGIENMDGRTSIRQGTGDRVALNNLPDTGSWGNYRWTTTATINLSAGEQTLVWENLQGGGINLDAFCLTDDDKWNPEQAIEIFSWEGRYTLQTPVPPKHLLFIQAEACTKATGKEIQIAKSKVLYQSSQNRIAIDAQKFPNWQNWEGAEVHIFPSWGWVNAILPVTSVDRSSTALLVNSNENIRPGNRFFIENVRDALENPNEWYLDRDRGELLYLASNDDFSEQKSIVAPVVDKLLLLQGDSEREAFVEHLHFQGLTFKDTDYTLANDYYVPADAAIWLSAARHCSIEDCSFSLLAGYGIRLEKRSSNNAIVNNSMTELGQGGIILLGNNNSQPFKNQIVGNKIEDCGRIYKHVAGIFATASSDNYIARNRIYRLPRYGISLKSYAADYYSHNNIVEFNEIVDSNLETHDTGAIETLGRDRQMSGNIIRFNSIFQVLGMTSKEDGQILSPYGTWGIYLDDFSSDTHVYGNTIIGTVQGGVCIHGGQKNRIENNIFINGAETQMVLAPEDDFMKDNQIKNNIFVYQTTQGSLYSTIGKTWRSSVLSNCNHNLYWHTGQLNLASEEIQITPEGSYNQWRVAGFDLNSIVADPMFVAPEKGDYRLKSASPALKLGFKPIEATSK